MSENPEDITDLLEVGIQAVVATQPNSPQSPRYLVPLKGWEVGEYLMFEAPIARKEDVGSGTRHRRISVRKKSEVVIRFIREGRVCAFREVVTDSLTLRDLPHFTVKWPVAFETAYVRKHERVRLRGAATLTFSNGTSMDASLRDISEGGCALEMESALAKGAEFNLEMRLPDGAILENIKASVRNIRTSEQGVVHGIQFESMDDLVSQDIRIIVKTAMANYRESETDENVAVIALTGKSASGAAFNGIRFKGVDFIVVHDVVECFYLLRSLSCIAFIVDCDHDSWDGLDIAGYVHDSPKTSDVKLVVYGVAAGQVEVATTILGADLCLPKGTPPHELAQQLAQLLADSIPAFA